MTTSQALTETQSAEYRSKGFVHLRGVFDASDVARLSRAADALLEMRELLLEDNLRVVLRAVRGTTQVLQINQVHELSPTFESVVRDPRLLAPIASIFGGEARAFKAKIIYKPPGAKGAILHQDYAYWQSLPSRSLLTAAVAIDPSTRDNGGMRLYPDWQRGLLATNEILCVQTGALAEVRGVFCETAPGDVILFNCMVPHESGDNCSEGCRRQLFISYNEASSGDLSELHHQHFLEYTRQRFIDDVERRSRSYFR